MIARLILLFLLHIILAVAPATAQETGFAVRQTEVKKEPYSDAAAVGTLPEKTPVKLVKREGGWMLIESAAAAGKAKAPAAAIANAKHAVRFIICFLLETRMLTYPISRARDTVRGCTRASVVWCNAQHRSREKFPASVSVVFGESFQTERTPASQA